MKPWLHFCLLATLAVGGAQADDQPSSQPLIPPIPIIGQPALSIVTEVQAAARARAILAQRYNAAPNGWTLFSRIGGPWRLGNWAAPDVSRHLTHQTFSGHPIYDGLAWFVHFRPAVRPVQPMILGAYRSGAVSSANRDDFTLVIGDQGQLLTSIIRID